MAGVITNDIESFIDAIEKRPALYLKSLRANCDVNYKRKLWEEVCLEVVSGWTKLDAEKQTNICTDVQKKWLNLRTCFSRELKAQKSKSGETCKRRKYIYYDKLLFLKSSSTQRGRPSICTIPTESNIDSCDGEEEKESNTRESNYEVTPPRPAKQPKKPKSANAKISFKQSLLNILQEDLDEDKNFALSLVPTLRSLTEDEKLEAKIEILQIFRRIKNKRLSQRNNTTTYI